MFVATGLGGTNTVAYSLNGIVWTGSGLIFTKYGNNVSWLGSQFIAGGGTYFPLYLSVGYQGSKIYSYLFSHLPQNKRERIILIVTGNLHRNMADNFLRILRIYQKNRLSYYILRITLSDYKNHLQTLMLFIVITLRCKMTQNH